MSEHSQASRWVQRAGSRGSQALLVCQLALLVGVMLLVARPAAGQQQERVPQVHVVERGETLYRIARNNGLTVQELQRLNDLEGTTIRVGQRLVVGYRATESAAEAEVEAETEREAPAVEAPPAEAPPAEAPTYTARPGDTFYSIALRYGVTADTLFALNGAQTAPLEPGQPVRLPLSFGPTTYVVQPGETLAGIARRYGLEVEVLRSVNRRVADSLEAGQTLRIPARRMPVVTRPAVLSPPDTTGSLSPYPETFAGRLTASGEPYDPERFTVSHPRLPFGTVLLLSSPSTSRRIFAVVNDRSPAGASYLMDASAAVIAALGAGQQRLPTVEVHAVR